MAISRCHCVMLVSYLCARSSTVFASIYSVLTPCSAAFLATATQRCVLPTPGIPVRNSPIGFLCDGSTVPSITACVNFRAVIFIDFCCDEKGWKRPKSESACSTVKGEPLSSGTGAKACATGISGCRCHALSRCNAERSQREGLKRSIPVIPTIGWS